MAPVGEDEPTHDCPSSPSSPTSPSHTSADTNLKAGLEEVSELHQRLAHLEDDNASLRASCVSLQLKLDQVQLDDANIIPQKSTSEGEKYTSTEAVSVVSCQESSLACSKCVHLSEELALSQTRCSDLENLHQKLENQIQVLEKQVRDFEVKENEYKLEISTLELKLNPVCSDETDHSIRDVVERNVGSDECTGKVDMEIQQSLGLDSSDIVSSVEKKSQTESVEDVEVLRQKLKKMEKKFEDLQEKCRTAELEKTTLRTNIHKVSANWFERKTRLSESESESPHNEEESTSPDSLSVNERKGTEITDFTSEYRFWIKRMNGVPKLLAEITFLNGKLDLTEKMCTELRKRVREYENVIDDQEIIIHGLKDQLDTYFTDNQKMSKQLSALTKLFEDIELTERTRVNLVNPPETLSSLPNNLPTGEDFKEMANSLSKTYIKLKELILEKKSLVTEIERLNVLNVELQRRVVQQENRLISVSDALHTTWVLISDVKEQTAQLHSSESILRYELKEKRELLHRLREELECSREQWHKIRQMNSKSEEEWNSIREELDERRRVAENKDENGEQDHLEGAAALQGDKNTTSDFEPPVDLLLDMAIEYGVMEADDDTSTLLVAALEGEDMHASRLQDLEDQCSHLYQKLMASTSRSLTLASRLTALHQHYGSSDEDEDEDEDEEDYEEEEEDDEEAYIPFETEVMSPEPESYDTAYVSEPDTGSASGAPGIISEEETATTNIGGSSMEDASCPTEEQAAEVEDDLCRGLINFLPRKIEILRRDNQKLEEKYQLLQEEKLHSEAQLTASLETEKLIRLQLEEKLEHLGKCVDELKLERNGQIREAEDKLKQKVASLSEREKEYDSLQEDLSSLNEKFEERGTLLQIANDRVKQVESELHTVETAAQDTITQLNLAKNQAKEFKELHEQLNSEYKELKEEVLALQQQLADLRFQVSSQSMERETSLKADTEKSEALEVVTAQVAEQKAIIAQLQKETTSQQELLQTEKDQLVSQVEKLNKILADRDQECSVLSQHLQEAEVASKAAQVALSQTQAKLGTNEETTNLLNDDNSQLREKVIQLLSRRVRVCDDCFSIHAELATIIASPAGQSDSVAGSEVSSKTEGGPETSHKGRSVPIGSQLPDDEEFSVISDDELHNSRLSSSPSSGSSPASNEVVTETRATADILTPTSLSVSPPTNAEAWVGAGTRVLVPVDLPAGVTLHWHFVSEPKSVSFAVLHQPPQSENCEESCHSSQQRVLIPTTRVASAEGAAVKGRLQTKQPGVYTLVFDNSCSRFTAKKVTYSLRLENQVNLATSTTVTSSSSSPPSQSEVCLPAP